MSVMVYYLQRRMKKTVLLGLLCCFVWAVSAQARDMARPLLPVQVMPLPSGAKLYFMQTQVQPMVDVNVLFHAGSAYDGQQHGVAYMVNAMLNQGSQHKNAAAIAEGFAKVGAIYHHRVTTASASVGVRSMARPASLRTALGELHAVLTSPAFSQQAFARMQQRVVALIRRESEHPMREATKAFYAALYQSLPYAYPTKGSVASVKAMRIAALKAFYARYYTQQDAVVVIVGDITPARARTDAVALLKGLPRGKRVPPLPAATPLAKSNTIHLVEPHAQTSFVCGQLGVTRRYPDYPALLIANLLLGGGQQSRLFDVLRNEHGLVYGIGSTFSPAPYRGQFYMAWRTRANEAARSRDLVQQTFARFVQQGPSDRAVRAAKQKIEGDMLLQLTSNRQRLQAISQIAFYQLPLNYYDQLLRRLQGVSGAQVRHATKAFFQPHRMLWVQVGEKDA